MAYIIKTKDDADKVLRRFNCFHDGLLKSLRLYSRDYFDTNKNQICTGIFDVCIEFAHYNYNGGKPPFNRIIQAYFADVKDFSLALDEIKKGDWSIVGVEFKKTKRVDINDKPEPCFVIKITFNFYDKNNNKWINLVKSLFSFKEARFVELTMDSKKDIRVR